MNDDTRVIAALRELDKARSAALQNIERHDRKQRRMWWALGLMIGLYVFASVMAVAS